MIGDRLQRILIVEDDRELSEMLGAYFGVQGYEVLTAAWGEEAVKICFETSPDLVVLDIRLPDIDGFEVARRLLAKRRTKNLPVIFLTERRDRLDKLAGLELGVVDYITKPFDIQELRLRVRNVLRRASSRQSLDNPVTGLPDGTLVDERLGELLADGGSWALLVVTLRGLSHFREAYGFVASDDVLRAVSLMIKSTLAEVGQNGEEVFLGHLGQEEFVLVTTEKRLKLLQARLQERISSSLDYFYPLKDRRSRDEEGEERLALKVGSVRSGDGPFADVSALKKAGLSVPEAI